MTTAASAAAADLRSAEPWAPGRVIVNASTYKERENIVPLIDRVHRLMHLWRAGEATEVDEYLETQGLRGNAVFPKLLQALIELCEAGSEERALLESLSNHLGSRGRRVAEAPRLVVDDPA